MNEKLKIESTEQSSERTRAEGDLNFWRDLPEKLIFGPPSASLRFKFFLTGCLCPAACAGFVAYADRPPLIGITWQSGDTSAYIAMLLTWPCELIFLPLIVFSILSLAAWTLWPKSGRWLIVRLGVYSGVPLAGQYLYFILMTSSIVTFVCAAILAPLLAVSMFVIDYFLRRIHRFSILHLLLFMTIVAMICGVFQLTETWRRLIESPLIIAAATPTLNLITYFRAAIMVAAQRSEEEMQRPNWLGWLVALPLLAAAWSVSWKLAIDTMLIEYAKLPTTSRNCYLSAAATHRHRWLFRDTHNGVSLQTKRLKFLEIALRCAAPKLHSALRKAYDHFGPPLAGLCRRSHWFADVTYLVLVPLEATATLLRASIRVPSARIEGIYSKAHSDSKDS